MTRPDASPAFALDDVTKHYPSFTLGPLSLSLDPGIVLALVVVAAMAAFNYGLFMGRRSIRAA